MGFIIWIHFLCLVFWYRWRVSPHGGSLDYDYLTVSACRKGTLWNRVLLVEWTGTNCQFHGTMDETNGLLA